MFREQSNRFVKSQANCKRIEIASGSTEQVARMSAAICGIDKAKTPDVAEPVIGRAFARPVGSPKLRLLRIPQDRLQQSWKRRIDVGFANDVAVFDTFFDVRIKPASRRIRKWFERVDLAISGHGAASVQDMQQVARMSTAICGIDKAKTPDVA